MFHYFLFLLFLFWDLGLGDSVTLHVTVTVTGSHDMMKDKEELRTNDIIQYDNSILTLQLIYVL